MKQTYSQKWRRLKAIMIALIVLCSCGITALVTYAAAGDPTIYFGGNVSFTATGVNAIVTAGDTTDSGLTLSSTPDTLVYSTKSSDSNSGDATSWENLTVTLSKQTATFTFTIENTADTGDLSVTVTLGDDYDTDVLTISVTDGSASIDGVAQTVGEGETLTVVVTFELKSTTYNVSSAFSIKVDLSGTSTVTAGYTLTNSSYVDPMIPIASSDGCDYTYISINGDEAITLHDLSSSVSNVKTIQLTCTSTYVTGTITVGDREYTLDGATFDSGVITLTGNISISFSLTFDELGESASF